MADEKKKDQVFWVMVFLAILGLLTCVFPIVRYKFIHHVSYPITQATYDISEPERFQLSPIDKPTLVHFYDDTCLCTIYSKPHVADLAKKLPDVEHVYINTRQDRSSHSPVIQRILAKLPASPAVALWDKDGGIRYFGAYSDGSTCGTGNDMVLATLSSLEKGDDVYWLQQEYLGCVCPWPKQETAPEVNSSDG
ncbi:DUF6436 domain-containing protein [Saccharophagus degradans]|uniref:DUF6436 domain-containing protein n=1 Tax=Saccharophagus degradans TaxID=86304 RepID=UPI002477E165|nr:DUF6436 domain-containing protein [Saccharophagus degradans]WGO96903.1 DUF6436 domain-containing protein [Saccharophagus degradans]